MTAYQLVERDLHKAEMNLERAKAKPNVSPSELEHLEGLVALRKEIFERIRNIQKGK